MSIEKIKTIGYGSLGILIWISGFILLAVTLILGAEIITVILPFFVDGYRLGFWIAVIIALLGLLKKLKKFSAISLLIYSYWVGTTFWLWAFLVAYELAGLSWLITGIIFFGVTIAPISIVACIIHGQWTIIITFLFMLATHFGSRIVAIKYFEQSEQNNEIIDIAEYDEETIRNSVLISKYPQTDEEESDLIIEKLKSLFNEYINSKNKYFCLQINDSEFTKPIEVIFVENQKLVMEVEIWTEVKLFEKDDENGEVEILLSKNHSYSQEINFNENELLILKGIVTNYGLSYTEEVRKIKYGQTNKIQYTKFIRVFLPEEDYIFVELIEDIYTKICGIQFNEEYLEFSLAK